MAKRSAGLLLYRHRAGELQVLLVHPGGPFWRRKDAGAWSIPKGEFGADEEALGAAKREFAEEIGVEPRGEFLELAPVTQRGGKVVHAWAVEGDLDPSSIRSNTFEMEWPPRSGKRQKFPEIDRAAFFDIAEAKRKINPGQLPLIHELDRRVGAS